MGRPLAHTGVTRPPCQSDGGQHQLKDSLTVCPIACRCFCKAESKQQCILICSESTVAICGYSTNSASICHDHQGKLLPREQGQHSTSSSHVVAGLAPHIPPHQSHSRQCQVPPKRARMPHSALCPPRVSRCVTSLLETMAIAESTVIVSKLWV